MRCFPHVIGVTAAVLQATVWSHWFIERRFGLDPWFYFAAGETGSTACRANVRLSLSRIRDDSVDLQWIDDRRPVPVVLARCTVRFAELTGVPRQGTLPDGRVLWRLSAVIVSGARTTRPPLGQTSHTPPKDDSRMFAAERRAPVLITNERKTP